MSRIVYGTKLHTADLNDSFCEITSLNRVNASIFGASGSNQTTTGSIATGSSILTLSSPIDFANGQGIRIDGAGTDGDGTRLIATIIAGAGSTTLILSKPADTSVTAANVWHDDTAAIQSAINFLAANGGGQVDFGAGQFNLGGAPQRPSTVNAILTLPMIALGSDISIGFRGTAAIGNYRENMPDVPPANGTVFFFPYTCTSSNANIVSGIAPAVFNYNPSAGFSWMTFRMENITWRTQLNSGYVVTNLGFVANSEIENCSWDVNCNLGSSGPLLAALPTQPGEAALQLPGQGNSSCVYGRGLYAIGYYAGIIASEHTVLDRVYVQNCVNALCLSHNADHPAHVNKFLAQQCVNVIYVMPNTFPPGGSSTNFTGLSGSIDIEANTTPGAVYLFGKILFNQTSNAVLYGNIEYQMTNTGTGATPVVGSVGSNHARFYNPNGPGEKDTVVTPGSSPFSFTTVFPGMMAVFGGAVTIIAITRNSVTTTLTGITQGTFYLTWEDTIVVTYTTAPTMHFFPI